MVLALLSTAGCGLVFAQAADPGAAVDRGYAEGNLVSHGPGSSSALAGVDSGADVSAASARGRQSASTIATRTDTIRHGEMFRTPQAAVEAFIDALRSGDEARLEQIFGPQSGRLLSSGDHVADANERKSFLRHYDRKHSLSGEQTGMVTLVVGESAWPFSVPIVKGKEGYYFNSAAGEREVLFRRIGRNERNVVSVCSGFVAAQKEYALMGHDGLPPGLYAQKLKSDEHKQNGLYWPVQADALRSPAGPLLASAADQGYGEGAGRLTPYHGYLYRVLNAQSAAARGGAKKYIDSEGRQSGGFALLAYPAEYGRSGVKSFMVNQDGIVYEKDLGERTTEIARQMQEFDPKGWRTAL
jgi:hypothetical protein